MLKLHEQRHIKLFKVEQANAWLVVAVLFETRGNETVAISEPKVVKVISKPFTALPGQTSSLLLTAPHKAVLSVSKPVLSPFASFFGYTNTKIVTGLGAQPPTKK